MRFDTDLTLILTLNLKYLNTNHLLLTPEQKLWKATLYPWTLTPNSRPLILTLNPTYKISAIYHIIEVIGKIAIFQVETAACSASLQEHTKVI